MKDEAPPSRLIPTFVDIPDRRVRVWTVGDGPPAVLLHGFSDAGSCWVGVAPLFSRRGYRVVAPDARGHGRTPLLADDDFTAGARVRDARAVMETLGIEGALVVGHSMGAITAMELAARQRSLVGAVILIDPPLTGDGRDGGVDDGFSFEAWINEVVALRPEALADVCRRDNPEWTDEEIDAWVVSKREMDRNVFRRPQSRYDGPWRPAMEAISCPALVVAGETEFGSLVGDGAGRWLDDAPNVEFVRIEGAGHSVHRDARERFAAVVEAFLDR